MDCDNKTNMTCTCHLNFTDKFQVSLSSHSLICSQKFREINHQHGEVIGVALTSAL
jgi:hypothetical protein